MDVSKTNNHRFDAAALENFLKQDPMSSGRMILRLAWKAGLLREEIRQLTWADFPAENCQLRLSDRTIPLDEETCRCLQARRNLYETFSPYVIISRRLRKQLAAESVSRLARETLDRSGLKHIGLSDLRHDFIIRQLSLHDWPYVAKISGLSVSTLFSNFREFLPASRSDLPRPPTSVREENILALLQSNEGTPVGLALWLAWKLGLQMKEILTLTWPQIDFYQNMVHLEDRDVFLDAKSWRILRKTAKQQVAAPYTQVLLTPKSQKPFDGPGLSKVVRTALIRADMEDITFRDLTQVGKTAQEKQILLQYVRAHGMISRKEACSLLNLSALTVYKLLSSLAADKELVLIGKKYYLSEHVVSPDEQYAVICRHLREVHSAYRQELADILHIAPRPCSYLLQKLVKSGRLVQCGQLYYLPPDADT